MQYKGVLKKMLTELGSPIQYYLEMEDSFHMVKNHIWEEIPKGAWIPYWLPK